MRNKAATFLKQAFSLLVTMVKAKSMALKSKTRAIKARLLIFSLLRSKKLLMSAINHRLHALIHQENRAQTARKKAEEEEEEEHSKPIVWHNNAAINEAPLNSADMESAELAEEDEEDEYPDLRHSLFELEEEDEDDELVNGTGSVIDLVRNSKEDGAEFNLEDEIDHVADVFIKRFHRQMMIQKQDSFKRLFVFGRVVCRSSCVTMLFVRMGFHVYASDDALLIPSPARKASVRGVRCSSEASGQRGGPEKTADHLLWFGESPCRTRWFAGFDKHDSEVLLRAGRRRSSRDPKEGTITVADDGVPPAIRAVSPPIDLIVFVAKEVIASEPNAPERSGDSIGPAISSGGAEPASTVFNVRYVARSICQKLENVERTGATREQVTGLEWKVDDVLAILRRLDPSEAEKALEALETKCAGQESNLTAAKAGIEVLEKEKAGLVSRVEELEEGNRLARSGVVSGVASGSQTVGGRLIKSSLVDPAEVVSERDGEEVAQPSEGDVARL
ncbi:hypothetical protein AXF42_Ash011138 [Apostasia shenzhenica]|uniref:Uncharacterized protein n=1 Tax=Apostasia shenzhenica TaxID=1088818 RepID=A0A2I0AKX6_9ASPA|nr:hypothetical protein AXF42_Ash011138 [Apostasia shenzhenica]